MSDSVKSTAISLIDAAYGCEFVSKTALAEIYYLSTEYKLSEQSLNILAFFLMVLHHKMDNGDVCVKLDEDSIKNTVLQWILVLEEKSFLTDSEQFFLDFAKDFSAKNFSELLDSLRSIAAIGGADDDKPLVISLNRLYLRRYFNYERKVAAFVSGQSKKEAAQDMLLKAHDFLNLLFGKNNDGEAVNWQKVAAALPVFSRFCVISGGPGTGKTTTVLRILLLLRALYGLEPKILLAAPTGKAASRMAQSIGSQLQNADFADTASFAFAARELAQKCGFDFSDLVASIPRNASTVHSLLNVIVHKVTPRYNENYPLDCDILVVDEVSMVDLSLFYKIIAALKDGATLIMLGDKDQLCSVESGAVLGDICAKLSDNDKNAVSASTLELLSKLSGYSAEKLLKEGALSDYTVLLRHSWRFKNVRGIGALATAVNAAPSAVKENGRHQITDILEEYRDNGLAYMRVDKKKLAKGSPFMRGLIRDVILSKSRYSYKAYLDYLSVLNFCVDSDATAYEILKRMDEFRILCSNHSFILGDRNLNALIESEIKNRFALGNKEFFPGKIVLITKNDAGLSVHNGDVGFVAYDGTDEKKALKVFIPSEKYGLLKVSPIFLKHYESGFAMTVHKSQGSEYKNILIALSPKDNPILTKELVYTAVTRAKEWVTMVAIEEVLLQACSRKVQRQSGLAERIENKEAMPQTKKAVQISTDILDFSKEIPEDNYSICF